MIFQHLAHGQILVEHREVTRVTLKRPDKANAITGDMWAALAALWPVVAADPVCRAVILEGEGSHFSGGADMSEFGNAYNDSSSTAAYNGTYRTAVDGLAELPMPAIAALQGAVIGGAFALALACDLRIGTTTCQLSVTAAKYGFAFDPQDTTRLIALTNMARAKDMLYLARAVKAEEAMEWGLLDRLAPEAELSACALKLAQDIAASQPGSVRVMKTIVNTLAAPNSGLLEELRPIYTGSFANLPPAPHQD